MHTYLLLVVKFIEVGHLVSPHFGASGSVQTVVVQSRSPLAVLWPPQHLLYHVQRQQTLREYQNFLFQFPSLFQQLEQKLNLPADSRARLAVGGQKVVVPLQRGRGTKGGFVVGRGDDVAAVSLLGGWFCGASDSFGRGRGIWVWFGRGRSIWVWFGRGRGIWVWFEADGWECDIVFITTTQLYTREREGDERERVCVFWQLPTDPILPLLYCLHAKKGFCCC